ncbi:hypothetical protein [Nocardia sp. NPDC051570]|uniref:hypothetical protein n=1 Tax=Nocardia sp. NPDC051570 TaxID=3364324 RepID=UPI003788968D
MAMQQRPQVRGAPPAALVAVAPIPEAIALQAISPSAPRTVMVTEVPVIRPYLVAMFTGSAAVAAGCDLTRAVVSASAAAIGALSENQSSWSAIPSTAGGTGSAGARVVIKSGRALFAAAPAATGAADAEIKVAEVASAGSEGVATVVCLGTATADAVFNSEGRYSGRSPETTRGGSEGTLAAVTAATGKVVVAVDYSGSGVCSATSGSSFATSGGGALSVLTGLPAGSAGEGVLTQVSSARAAAEAGYACAGSLTVDAIPSFQPSSMTKSGSWNGLGGSTWGTVSGWKADTARYPGSVVSSDGLVVQNSKVGAKIAASVVFSGASQFVGDIPVRIQLVVNTTVVFTGDPTPIPGAGSAAVTASTIRNLQAGDVITVQAKSDAYQFNPTAETNSASYVRVT